MALLRGPKLGSGFPRLMSKAEARQRIEAIWRMGPAELAAAAAECGRLCVITGALQREFGVPLILARLLARKHPVQEYTFSTPHSPRRSERRRAPRCGRRLTLLLVRD